MLAPDVSQNPDDEIQVVADRDGGQLLKTPYTEPGRGVRPQDRDPVGAMRMPEVVQASAAELRANGLEEIRRLPTLHSMSVGAKPGDLLSRVAGLVTLIDEDLQAIERDVAAIRAVERKGIFEVEQEPPA